MTVQRKLVKVGARDVPAVGNAFRSLALRDLLELFKQLPAGWFAMDIAIATHRHARHALRAARNDDIAGAGGNGIVANVHGRSADPHLRSTVMPGSRAATRR